MLSAQPKILEKKKRPSKRMIAIRVSAFKSKPSIVMNGKRVPPRLWKCLPQTPEESLPPQGEKLLIQGEKPASWKNVTDSRKKPSASRRKASVSWRKNSDSRRKSILNIWKTSFFSFQLQREAIEKVEFYHGWTLRVVG